MMVKRLLWFFSASAMFLLALTLLWNGDFTSAMATEGAVVPSNTPPVAVFTVDPASGGVVGTWFYFDPTGSHDEEDSLVWLTMRFDWTSDGNYDTGWLNPTNPHPRHRYDAVGTYTVRMIVMDKEGLTDTVEHDVVVGDPGSNTPPTASCTVTPTVGTVNTIFTYSAASSTDQQDSVSDLIARWDWYGGGKWITEWLPATASQTFQFDRHGLKTVRLEVRDRGMLSDSAECEVEVQPEQPNTPPTASFTFTPDHGDTTTQFTFDPSGSSDIEDEVRWLSARFDWTNDGSWDSIWLNASQTQHHVFEAWGEVTVRMMVMDTGGLSDETTRTVNITPFSLYLPLVE